MSLLRPLCTALLSALALSATADDFPNKAIRFIMPYPIGGSIDIAGRMVAQRLADKIATPLVPTIMVAAAIIGPNAASTVVLTNPLMLTVVPAKPVRTLLFASDSAVSSSRLMLRCKLA